MMDPAKAGLAQRIYDRLTGADRRRERAAIIRQLPDRRLLIDVYIPAFAAEAGRILWVGCRAYTLDDYKALESGGGEVWTTDLDPRAEKWGRRGRHRTGDLCGVDEVFLDITFDAIICNGVFGYGVDTPDQQLAAMRAMAMILRPGGRLLLGWNTDRSPIRSSKVDPGFGVTRYRLQVSRRGFASMRSPTPMTRWFENAR